MSECLRAVQQIRRLRGGSQAHLMRCADKRFYVVKFRNNAQGGRVLANEMLATRLGVLMGLPMAEARIIDVDPVLILLATEMVIQLERHHRRCAEGHSFGSLYVGNPAQTTDWYDGTDPPSRGQPTVANLSDFVGMVVFDTWMSNTDSRQAVFHRERPGEPYHATMIDHGFCLSGKEWRFDERPCRFLHPRWWVYENVSGIQAFEPWLSLLERKISLDDILAAAVGIPPEWYHYDLDALVAVARALDARRPLVRQMIWQIHASRPMAFPNWLP